MDFSNVSFLSVSLSIASCTSLALLPLILLIHESHPPQVIELRILPTPSRMDLPNVTKKSPFKTSLRIPLTALNTASSKPPTTSLSPSLNISIIETIQPIIGTSSILSATFSKAPPNPLLVSINPS